MLRDRGAAIDLFALVPALPGVVTQGDTFEEALAMARDAIALYLEDLVKVRVDTHN